MRSGEPAAPTNEDNNMKHAAYVVAAALLAGAPLAGTAAAQGALQTVSLVRVDVTKLATGFRSSKVVGSAVVNDANETVGKIDDLLVAPDGRALFAIVSVG